MIRTLLLPFFILSIFIVCSLIGLDDFIPQRSSSIQTGTSFFMRIYDNLLAILPQLLQAGIWLSAAWFIDRLIIIFFWEQRSIPKLLKDIVTLIIFMIAVSGIIVITFGQPITGIWATSGAVGIILGFALKNVILDTFIGVSINLDKPYKIGDFVGIHTNRNPQLNIRGHIAEISWRTTRIETREGNYVILPNRVLGDMMVTNYMSPESKCIQKLSFTLDFSIHPERALRILSAGTKAALGKNNALELPAPKIMVHDITDSSIEYLIWFWVAEDVWPEQARHFVVKSIVEHLQRAGLKRDPNAPMPTAYVKENIEYRVGRLAQIELFSPLSMDELNTLAHQVSMLLYKENEVIVQQGEAGGSMFIIVEGLLNVFIGDAEQHVKVAQMIGGEFFGELSLFTGQARTATVMAATEVILYEISKADILPLLVQKPEIAELVSQVVAERELRTSKAYEHLARKEEKQAKTETRAKQILFAIRAYLGL